MTEAELEQVLQATRAANSNQDHHWYRKEAWLLIALYRHAEGLAVAQQAQRAWADIDSFIFAAMPPKNWLSSTSRPMPSDRLASSNDLLPTPTIGLRGRLL
ncbi:hypothetical protein GFS31_33250 [Leptolyngbya sp. BL0902]|nr:hypothetical protein GFS31_33250 [Leptolyngbya sp. BL0902]